MWRGVAWRGVACCSSSLTVRTALPTAAHAHCRCRSRTAVALGEGRGYLFLLMATRCPALPCPALPGSARLFASWKISYFCDDVLRVSSTFPFARRLSSSRKIPMRYPGACAVCRCRVPCAVCPRSLQPAASRTALRYRKRKFDPAVLPALPAL